MAEETEERAAKSLATLCRKSDDFDATYNQVVENLRPLARKEHGRIRLKRHVLKPLSVELGTDETAEAVLAALVNNPAAVAIINAMHQDVIAAQAAITPTPTQEVVEEEEAVTDDDEEESGSAA